MPLISFGTEMKRIKWLYREKVLVGDEKGDACGEEDTRALPR